jgi:endonuclease III
MPGAVRGLSARLREVSGLLAGRFGRPEICVHETDPVRNLVLTILSQNTTDANRDRAYDRLAKRFSTLPALAAARPSELEEAIRAATPSTSCGGCRFPRRGSTSPPSPVWA